MRVVVFQGQYGLFKRKGLDLSMPAVQTCIGLYAFSEQHDYLLCAHFDTELGLQQNLQSIRLMVESKGVSIRSLRATIFGGDGKQSYFRCSKPSSHIGNEIVNFIKLQGGIAEYSNQYYSGFVPKTFNFHYRKGFSISEGENPRDFSGGSQAVENLGRLRIKLRPSEYSFALAKMTDISKFYSG